MWFYFSHLQIISYMWLYISQCNFYFLHLQIISYTWLYISQCHYFSYLRIYISHVTIHLTMWFWQLRIYSSYGDYISHLWLSPNFDFISCDCNFISYRFISHIYTFISHTVTIYLIIPTLFLLIAKIYIKIWFYSLYLWIYFLWLWPYISQCDFSSHNWLFLVIVNLCYNVTLFLILKFIPQLLSFLLCSRNRFP